VALTDGERHQLDSFRRAARQVRDATIIARGETIDLVVRRGEPGYMDVFIKLLAEEPFRSLSTAIRLAYMKGEPAHFYSICNLLYREGDANIRSTVVALRQRYTDALRDPENQLVVDDGLEPKVFTAQEVFEHWLYGVVFHQDQWRQEPVRRLAALGFPFPRSVQATALQLSGRIIDLDDVVADFLGEQRVERI
jgi:hypothetical protein